MNWRRLVLLAYVIAWVFAASTSTAQMMGHRNSVSRIGMRGAFTPPSNARMPTHHAPTMNPAFLPHLNRFNYDGFDRESRFRRAHGFNKIIFIRSFGFPWGPWWGWNSGYYSHGPYEYSEYSYPPYYSSPSSYSGYGYEYGNYGYDYAYDFPPLLYYGGYYSGTKYENDESVVRDALAEYTVSWNRHDTAALARLFAENCDYLDIAGVHWKGVHEIVQRHAELFQHGLKTAARRLTGAEVTFPTPDVALIHATWDVTGWRRPTGESVPIRKESTTITMAKTNGKWLITDFQDTESGSSTR